MCLHKPTLQRNQYKVNLLVEAMTGLNDYPLPLVLSNFLVDLDKRQ